MTKLASAYEKSRSGPRFREHQLTGIAADGELEVGVEARLEQLVAASGELTLPTEGGPGHRRYQRQLAAEEGNNISRDICTIRNR